MNKLYRVSTYHNSILAAVDDGSVINIAQDAQIADLRPLVAFIPSEASTSCYLLADIHDSSTLRITHQTGTGPIVPLRCLRSSGTGIFHFYSPETSKFLCAAPISAETRTGPLALAPATPRQFESFTLQPLPKAVLSRTMMAQAEALEMLNDPEPDAELVARMIQQGAPPAGAADALNAVAALLRPAQLDTLARLLLRDKEATINGLRSLFPVDLYAHEAVPGLLLWLAAREDQSTRKASPAAADRPMETAAGASFLKRLLGREPAAGTVREISRPAVRPDDAGSPPAITTIRAIDTKFDRLHEDVLSKNYNALPFALNMRLRRMAEPARRACVIASARNEGLYILEWLAHHRAVGFDHIFIYSNDNDDGSDDLLRALAAAGELTWIESTIGAGCRAQAKAFGHALRVMPDTLDFEWSLLIDLDEFFVPSPMFGSVGSFLDWHETQSVDAIGINWQFVGSNSQTHWRDEPLFKRFPMAIGGANPHIKSMFRTRKFMHSFAHDPANVRDEHVEFRNSSRATHLFDPARSRGIALNPDISMAAVVHFFYKSNEEYVWKSSRNRGYHAVVAGQGAGSFNSGFITNFVETSDAGSVPTLMPAYEAIVAKQMARLLAYPDVATALKKIKVRFGSKIGPLIAQAASHPAMVAAGKPGQAFMAPLMTQRLPPTPHQFGANDGEGGIKTAASV